jgi:Yip1 domain
MTPEQSLDESPLISIWDAPRATIRQIVDRDPRRWVNSLFFAAGVIATLNGFTAAAEFFPVPIPLAGVPILCAMTGIVAIPVRHLGAWYKRLIGRLLGGQATQREVVAVAAWATVPTIVGHGALWIVRFALYGTEVLLPEHPTIDASSGLVQLSFGLAATLFSLWSGYVSIVGFAEVNRFSVARSVATSILTPVLILTAGVVILVGVIVFRASR